LQTIESVFSLSKFPSDIQGACAQILGFKEYSLLGWSQGSTTAAILAANYVKNVRKVVLWGACSYFTMEDVAKAKGKPEL